jgi:hypothetical protein
MKLRVHSRVSVSYVAGECIKVQLRSASVRLAVHGNFREITYLYLGGSNPQVELLKARSTYEGEYPAYDRSYVELLENDLARSHSSVNRTDR